MEEDGPTDAVIGYIHQDWEIGNDSYYFLEIDWPRARFERLADLIAKDRIKRCTLGLKSHQLFTDCFHAPPSMSVGWYLRPHKETGTVERAESANCWLTVLTITEATATLTAGDETDEESHDDSDDEVEHQGMPQETIAHPAQITESETRRLAAVESIAASLKTLPWVIGVAALIVAFA